MAVIITALSIGFFIAMPVGPIGVLCINRSVHHGFTMGLVTGLGAVTADAIYGLVAVLGVGYAHSGLTTILTMVAGVFIGSLGWWLILSGSISLIRHKLTHNTKRIINIISGCGIFIFGLACILSTLFVA